MSAIVAACVFCVFAALPFSSAASESAKLENDLITAVFSDSGLQSIVDHYSNTAVELDDQWSVEVERSGKPTTLDSQLCAVSMKPRRAAGGVTVGWHCSTSSQITYDVNVTYALQPAQRFVSKTLRISSSQLPFTLAQIDVWKLLFPKPSGCQTFVTRTNPGTGTDIVGYARFPNSSMFLSVANPFFKFEQALDVRDACSSVKAGYAPSMEFNSSFDEVFHEADVGVMGFADRGQYTDNDGIYVAEKNAFKDCAESFYLDAASRTNKTIKVNVAWDESDYQIDVGTAEGVAEYKRIIDRNAQLGIEAVVYEPQNSLHSSRFNTTDGWGWEMALWFSMGEKLRQGQWNPQKDSVPQDILDMVSYAKGKGVKLLAYVYPCLAFEEVKQYEFGRYNVLDLSQPAAASWLLETLSAFLTKTGAGGFSWDHDIMTQPARPYPQWRAWMILLKKLRERFPDIIMDHRQQNHKYGPWYQMAGSYAEPLGSDENPETYGVKIPSLHADHVAADQMRSINYFYACDQLIPAVRVPGFMFHQAERGYSQGGTPCEGGNKDCFSWNTRDFDLLGYKYSVISNVGTAGLNNVLTMIPARDEEEFRLLPKEDLDFIRHWVAWTDDHMDALRHALPITSLPRPGIGAVDGWHAMTKEDAGYVFIYNPNFRRRNVTLTLDESIGLSNASVHDSWIALELYPNERRRARGPWRHGESATIEIGGSDALVLEFQKTSRSHLGLKHPMLGTIGFGVGGEIARVPVSAAETVYAACEGLRHDTSEVDVTFAGPSVYHAMPISSQAVPDPFTGSWFNTSFSIPSAIKEQLHARSVKYPIQWTQHDLSATWLAPHRLLMTIYMEVPRIDQLVRMWINGTEVAVSQASNSRDAPSRTQQHTFLGYYYDASELEADVMHHVAVSFAAYKPGSAKFQGLFWENIETVYTNNISACRAVESSEATVYI